ncbi:MAG TPA: Rnase Y domain-containing protein, partial [Patescibacteria group bacterium]|nr:Rnase Y domain-containing protein [Patescibacteria group bacterium]
MTLIYSIIALVFGAIVGIFLGYQWRKAWAVKRKDTVETKVEALLNEAKAKQKEILLDANDKALKIIENVKVDEQQRKQELNRLQKRLEGREALFDQKLLDLEGKKQELLDRAEKLEKLKGEIGKIREEQIAKLEKIAELTKDQAKQIL